MSNCVVLSDWDLKRESTRPARYTESLDLSIRAATTESGRLIDLKWAVATSIMAETDATRTETMLSYSNDNFCLPLH